MEFKEVVKNRYSCKKYSDRQVEAEKLTAILNAGRLAPTAKNLQEQRIYVLQSPEALKKIDAVTPCRYGAPTVLVVAFNSRNVFTYPGGKRDSGVEDATIVATHMMLEIHDLGYGSTWIGHFDVNALAELFPETGDYNMIGLLPVSGIAMEPSERHALRKSPEELVTVL